MTSKDSRKHTNSVSSAGSLMQDVPGSFPIQTTQSFDQPAYHSLSQAVFARRSEYLRPEHVRIKVGSWNVASHKGTEKDLAGWFIQGKGIEEALTGLVVNDQKLLHRGAVPENGDDEREPVSTQEARYDKKQSSIPIGDPGTIVGEAEVGIYALCLQEVVDVNAVSEALRPYSDPSTSKKWKDALESALPTGYMLIAEQQLIGLLLLVYASPEIGKDVRGVSTTSVGTGIGGVMGNKGAVTTRIVLGETTRIVFVNSHLAAGADKAALERRNWDAAQVIQRTRFAPLQGVMDLNQTTGEMIGDEDFAFWAGDLNYRLEGIPGDDVRRLLMLHTRNEYDLSQAASQKIEHEIADAEKRSKKRASTASSISSTSDLSDQRSNHGSGATSSVIDEVMASDDPTSLQTTIDSLLPHDELHQQMKLRKAFHDGWREGQIKFLPTYKYDIGSVGVFDSSDKKRGPSYCDRILYRTRRDKLAYVAQVQQEKDNKQKDAKMKANGTDQAGDDEEILYDYDPDTDGNNDDYDENDFDEPENGVVVTKGGYEDEIVLECYVTHQRVLSSDHKPMDAVFMLKYDKVVPELKAKVHAEVAKELDKTENEQIPTVTVVVDKHRPNDKEVSDEDPASFQGVYFGHVRWAQAKHRSLTIANTGQVPATFQLIERPVADEQESGVSPSWLNLRLGDEDVASSGVSTKSITLEPGDAADISLEIRLLDIRMIRALNEGLKLLEDILVLRVDGGRDHFIPIRAKWQNTSLGHGIDKLIRIPEGGIRKLQRQSPVAVAQKNLDESLSKLSLDSPIKFSAPRELFRLTEAIEDLTTKVIAELEMTLADDIDPPWRRSAGWPLDEECWAERKTATWSETLSDLCDALDSDGPLVDSFPDRLPKAQRLYMLCNLLLIFLRNLPDGILPEPQWTQIEKQLADVEKSKDKPSLEEERTTIQEILASSPPNNICLILLTTMLDRIVKEISAAFSRSEAKVPAQSKTSTLKRMTGLSKLSSSSPREHADEVRGALAEIIAIAAIHPADHVDGKHKQAHEKHKIALVELFLTKEEPR